MKHVFIVLLVLNFEPFDFAHELCEQWSENPHLLWLDWLLWQIMEPVQIRILGSQHWNEDVLRLQNLVAAHHLRFFLLPHFRRDFNLGNKNVKTSKSFFSKHIESSKQPNCAWMICRRSRALRCWKSPLALYAWLGACWRGICLLIPLEFLGCVRGFTMVQTCSKWGVKSVQRDSFNKKLYELYWFVP